MHLERAGTPVRSGQRLLKQATRLMALAGPEDAHVIKVYVVQRVTCKADFRLTGLRL